MFSLISLQAPYPLCFQIPTISWIYSSLPFPLQELKLPLSSNLKKKASLTGFLSIQPLNMRFLKCKSSGWFSISYFTKSWFSDFLRKPLQNSSLGIRPVISGCSSVCNQSTSNVLSLAVSTGPTLFVAFLSVRRGFGGSYWEIINH